MGYRKLTNTYGPFQWADGSCPNYNGWGCNEPNNAGSGEPCTQYQFGGQTGTVGFTGKWNDYDCKGGASAVTFVCQVPIPKITTPSTACTGMLNDEESQHSKIDIWTYSSTLCKFGVNTFHSSGNITSLWGSAIPAQIRRSPLYLGRLGKYGDPDLNFSFVNYILLRFQVRSHSPILL